MLTNERDTECGPLPRAFRSRPRTGVIFVMTEAQRLGFDEQRAQWANLGQGAPETTAYAGGPARLHELSFSTDDHEYAPVAGLPDLRDAVAELYNQRYRQGSASRYTRENVAISAGGRLGLTRLVSALGHTNMGHFLPDYTAYEELLSTFGTLVPIPILTDPERNYAFDAADLEQEILGRGLSALLFSNPCNPTGRVVRGEELARWVDLVRELDCTLICDEFYSHYVYDNDALSLSAAAHVRDVNRDPVVLVDGLTKNWRYPGLRVSWTVGPRQVIEAVASAGSFLDGGCARPMQLAAIPLVERRIADAEARVIRSNFQAKRDLLFAGLRELGVQIAVPPEGGFYCWGDVSRLPERFNTGTSFFENALRAKVIVVPGGFFDINPGKRRPDRSCRFGRYVRFSFGPPEAEIRLGLEKLRNMLER